MGDAIAEALTPHQRAVLVAIALDDVPIDVLAERLDTTRGALYTTLRHARRELRARLAQHGLALDPSCERDTGSARLSRNDVERHSTGEFRRQVPASGRLVVAARRHCIRHRSP